MIKAKILVVILFIIKGIPITNAHEIHEPDSEKPHPESRNHYYPEKS